MISQPVSQKLQPSQKLFAGSDKFLDEIKNIQTNILNYIEKEDNEEESYKTMTQSLAILNTPDKKPELKYLLYLINIISSNHYHSPNFYDKIDQIILFLQDIIKQTFSNHEIFDLFQENKRVLLVLLQNEILLLDKKIADEMTSEKYNRFHYGKYFSPEIKKWKDKSPDNKLEVDYLKKAMKHHHFKHKKKIYFEEEEEEDNEKIEKIDSNLSFDELRKIGENESKICELIKNDSLDEFIVYVSQRCIKHTSEVKPSIFETNYLLNEKNPTLIEYAAFYGAVQIFKYLHLNGASLTHSMLNYAIHSKNDEMIFHLQEIIMKMDKDCLLESIKCHHIDIFNYIMDNGIVDASKDELIQFCLSCYNVICLPDDFTKYDESFLSACRYDYAPLAFHLLEMNHSLISLPKVLFYVNNVGNSEFLFYLLKQPGIKYDEKCLKKCKELKSVTIHSSEETIGESAFESCENLSDVLFESPSSLTHIGKSSFYNCKELSKISIPSSVKRIGEGAFSFGSSLHYVTFEAPCSLTSIMEAAFYSCNLIEVVIPSSVTIIGKRAFSSCEKIQKVTFETPSSITSIGERAFEECKSLVHFEIPPKVTVIEYGTFDSCSKLEKVTIPSSVTKICERAFGRCSSLKQIEFPSSITSIGKGSFSECSSLEKVNLPSSVASIEKRAFSQCTSLKEIILSSSLESISKKVFNKCKSLIKVKMPSSVKSIGDLAFKDCSSLQEVIFNSDSLLISIGSSCFENCSKLIKITIPSHVEKVESACFKMCSSLTKVVFLSSSIELINSSTFFNCSALKEVVLPPSLKVIGNLAFKNCTQLQKIEIPPNITNVGFSAFENCSSLTKLAFPSTVQSIGNWNFTGCTSLKEITIPASVEMNSSMIYPNIKVKKI